MIYQRNFAAYGTLYLCHNGILSKHLVTSESRMLRFCFTLENKLFDQIYKWIMISYKDRINISDAHQRSLAWNIIYGFST